jgi:hypothetical protein
LLTTKPLVLASRSAAAFVVAAAALTLACPDAEAGPISRPIRDTSSRTTSTSGKVLVAIPRHGTQYRYLHEATRTYHGPPVVCGLEPDYDPADAKLVLMKLPADLRYAAGYDLCRDRRAGYTTMQTVRGADRASRDLAMPTTDDASALPTDPMAAGFTVIAAGDTKRADLPADMQNDGWALLNANRFRDASAAFGEMDNLDADATAGQAIADAMTGSLEQAADALAQIQDTAAIADRLSDRVKRQLDTLAEMLEADRPDAAAVLSAIAGTGAAASGA